ncbi:hypothetical protein [Microbacterium lushaniae]|uniref:Uncharacterized protein n=1 Tax=Microbacterium lushaniae TaxID=2614639 RepID=A0A5J6L512_9MICO|nr:hypothetical protein [Microbacterium lushaniae]QEW03623.1 hypothetical protein F6J85_11295 [Microbacterium lushaniae]
MLEHLDPTTSMWKRHLLVITADCDFANNKHRGRITCVPLITAEEYLLAMHLPKQQALSSERFVRELQEEVAKIGSWRITDERLMEWVLEVESPTDIPAALGADPTQSATVERLARGLRAVNEVHHTFELASAALLEAQLLHNHPQSRANAASRLRSTVTNLFKQQPGDALFLSSIAPGHSQGYFAYLRQIEQVWEQDVALSTDRTSHEYHRISRFPDRYSHALVQQFAMVFMPIGLPTEYELSRGRYASAFEGVVA